MKLCLSHYIAKIIPDAKFEACSSSSFGDMTSQNFPQKKGTSHQIQLLSPENWFNFFKKWVLRPELFFSIHNWPLMPISAIFKQRKILSFSKSVLGRLDDKRAAATPLIDQFC